jgi:hypothetical protein
VELTHADGHTHIKEEANNNLSQIMEKNKVIFFLNSTGLPKTLQKYADTTARPEELTGSAMD